MRSLSRLAVLVGVLVGVGAVPAVAVAQSTRSLPAVVSSSTDWKLRDSLTAGPATTTFSLGTRPLVPFTGDWDANGSETSGIYSGGVLRLYNQIPLEATPTGITFGDSRGFPVAGDFDGDGRDDVAIYRNGTWQIRFADDGATSTLSFGSGSWPSTVPVAGDWDGDGTDGIGTYTYATAQWALRNSPTSNGGADVTFGFGTPNASYPVPGDWDTDGDDTVGVKTGMTWSLNKQNDDSAADVSFDYGAANDLPLTWKATPVQVQAPDFSITFSGSPDPVDARHNATFVARITNDGPAVARIPNMTRMIRYQIPSNMTNLAVSSPPNFTCFIESPGVVDCQRTAATTLAVGAHLEFTLFGSAPKDPGALSVTALADPIDAVPEADETDNSATATVQVQPPDFSITLTAPATADTGSVVEFDATVTNDGPAAARLPISTRLIRFEIPPEVSGHSVFSPVGYQCSSVGDNDIECAPSTTASLAVGGTIQFTLLAPAPATPGSLTATALADPLNAVPEQDESDNGATAVVTLEQSVQ